MATLHQTCDLEMARTALTTLNGNIAIRINNNDNIIRYRIIQFTPYSDQILVCVEILLFVWRFYETASNYIVQLIAIHLIVMDLCSYAQFVTNDNKTRSVECLLRCGQL